MFSFYARRDVRLMARIWGSFINFRNALFELHEWGWAAGFTRRSVMMNDDGSRKLNIDTAQYLCIWSNLTRECAHIYRCLPVGCRNTRNKLEY